MTEKVQCGMRLYDKKARSEMTCTLERGHEKPVHEMTINGKWLGGWVDQWAAETRRLWKGAKTTVQRPPLDMPPDWRGEPAPVEQPSLFADLPSSCEAPEKP